MRTITGQLPISVEQLRDFLRIECEDDDAQIERCIAAAVDHIETETQRDILVGDVVESFDCWHQVITLDRSPVIAVAAIAIDDVSVENPWRLKNKTSARAQVLFTSHPPFVTPNSLLEVAYETGMLNPSPRVIQCCLWAAAHFYLNREPEITGNVKQFEHGMTRLINGMKAGGYA